MQCKCTSAAGLLFTVTTVATIPIYFTMIAFPKWKQVGAPACSRASDRFTTLAWRSEFRCLQTNTMMKSRLSMLGACCLHAAAFVMWWTTGALKGAGTALRHRVRPAGSWHCCSRCGWMQASCSKEVHVDLPQHDPRDLCGSDVQVQVLRVRMI